jgi:oligosaccharide repeat unit polymerase
MGYWWLLWLALSISPLNELTAPSWIVIAQYLVLLVAFFAGHAAIKWFRPFDRMPRSDPLRDLHPERKRVSFALTAAVLLCSALLAIGMKLSDALEMSFVEHFIRMRANQTEGDATSLTGVRALDVLTKILAFPLSYTIIVSLLAIELKAFKSLFALCVVNFLCFVYLWQVNYPLIHFFWFLVFYTLLTAERCGSFNSKIIVSAGLLIGLLIASATNRGGAGVLAGIQHYIINYHLIGFSFYDFQYHDARSILHETTFGQSSLGFIDQMLHGVLKRMSVDYSAASFENSAFNDVPIDLGARVSLQFNAFGTILFTLYRDFAFIGIVIGGFIYGGAATLARYRSKYSWHAGAIFLLLASAWMMGMMVSPLEEAYFWFTIIALGLINVTNRGVRW